MLEQALEYLRRGWSVFPLMPKDKRPPKGFEWKPYQSTRPTEEQIRAWWTKWPQANIALACGALSGVIALDVDGEAGRASVAGKHLPLTPISETGREDGGHHYLFKHPGGFCHNFAHKVPGLDFRGDGGYIVLPPSIHPTGTSYAWNISPDDTELADAPKWLLELLKIDAGAVALTGDDLSGEDAPHWTAEVLQGVGEGQRNDTMTRLAGRYIGNGLDEGEVIEILKGVNARNKPPLLDAEIEQIVRSIAKTELRKQIASGKNPNTTAAAPELRETILGGLSDRFGVELVRIIKYITDPPTYRLVTALGEVRLGEVDGLIDQPKFRRKVAAASGIYIRRFKADEWDIMAQKLLDVCEPMEVAEEATEAGMVAAWLRHYFSEHVPEAREWREAATNGEPYVDDEGRLCISTIGLRQHLAHRLQERIQTKELAGALRSYGAKQEKASIRVSDTEVTSRSVWVLPSKTAVSGKTPLSRTVRV